VQELDVSRQTSMPAGQREGRRRLHTLRRVSLIIPRPEREGQGEPWPTRERTACAIDWIGTQCRHHGMIESPLLGFCIFCVTNGRPISFWKLGPTN
jgi:hypothetical protein